MTQPPQPVIDIIVHNPHQVDIVYRDQYGNMNHDLSIYAISAIAAYVYIRGLVSLKNAALYNNALPAYRYLQEVFQMDERRN
jgi:hypothetical protein